MMTAPTAAAMKNNIAATCSSRPKLASVSVLAAINPTQAVAISAESRPTAFWIAAAIPPCSGSLDGRQIQCGQRCTSENRACGKHDHSGQQIGDHVKSMRGGTDE
jgi:hypothetical protein